MNIYIGNLPHASTEENVRNLFEAYGNVSSVKIIKDKFTGQSKGFAFVDMPNADEAQAAIDGLNGSEVGGRRVRVNEAREPQARPQGGGRPQNGGGFGGPRGGSSFGGNRGGGSRY